MSMQVDLTTPLTREERAYLIERGQTHVIERADAQHGYDGSDDDLNEGDGTGTRFEAVTQGERAAERKQRLLEELAAIEAAEGNTADDDEDVELADKPYEEWSKAELDKELKTRELPGGGTNADKAARLRANDDEA
jgi:hypothetical protein